MSSEIELCAQAIIESFFLIVQATCKLNPPLASEEKLSRALLTAICSLQCGYMCRALIDQKVNRDQAEELVEQHLKELKEAILSKYDTLAKPWQH